VAYVVPEQGDDPVGLDQLRPWLGERLPDYMWPSSVVHLDRIPLTTNGKLDTAALPEPEGGEVADDYVAPSGPLEEQIAEIWHQVLGKRVGAHDAFVDIGGDSIRAVGLTGALHNAGLKITVRELFTHQTVARLAQLYADRSPTTH